MTSIALALAIAYCLIVCLLWRNDRNVLTYELQQMRWKLSEQCDSTTAHAHRSDSAEQTVKEQQLKIAELELRCIEAEKQSNYYRKAIDAMVANTTAVGRNRVPWATLIAEVLPHD